MDLTEKVMLRHLSKTQISEESKSVLVNCGSIAYANLCKNNIEKYIGTASIPIGLAGPIKVNGEFAKGEFYLPLATTEGALVASYDRGSRVLRNAGGVNTIIVDQGTSRSPGFLLYNLEDSKKFVKWIKSQKVQLKSVGEETTSHGKLKEVNVLHEGCMVIVFLQFYTGNAAGQNMVTVASQRILEYVREKTPIKIRFSCVETNFASDKKASFQSMMGVRGKKVAGEVFIPEKLINKYLHTTSEKIQQIWNFCIRNSHIAGYVGNQLHFANALAALYAACGQDIACVAESAIGVTSIQQTNQGLKMSATMPNIIVGTVGGGTALPSQKACLEILGITSKEQYESANKLAEIILSACLAGELSLIASVASEDFVSAHVRHGRKKNQT